MTFQPNRWLASIAFIVVGCQPTTSAISDADVAAIRAASATYVQTALTGVVDAWLAIATSDAIFMPPNQPRLETVEARREWNSLTPPLTALTVTPSEIIGRGDLAYVVGTFSVTFAPESVPPFTDTGNYIEIWRKGDDGVWRISRDIWNSEHPLPQ